MKASRRKLFLFGKYSLAVLPPKKWLTELGIKNGDWASLTFDRKKRRISIDFTNTTTPRELKSKAKNNTQLEDIPEL